MMSRTLLTFLGILCLTLSIFPYVNAEYKPKIFYLDHLCNSTIYVKENKDIRVQMDTALIEAGNYNCNATFAVYNPTIPGITLRANFKKLSVPYQSKDCLQEGLQIFDSNGSVVLPPYCKTSGPGQAFNLSTRAIVNLFSQENGGFRCLDSPNLDLIISPAIVKSADNNNNTCPPNFFDCDVDGLCIHSDLVCNGFNDCGNGKADEKNCLKVGWLIMTILLAVFGLSIGIFCCCCRFYIAKRMWESDRVEVQKYNYNGEKTKFAHFDENAVNSKKNSYYHN